MVTVQLLFMPKRPEQAVEVRLLVVAFLQFHAVRVIDRLELTFES